MRSISLIATAALLFASAAIASPTPAVETEVSARHLTEKLHESSGNVARAWIWGCPTSKYPLCGYGGYRWYDNLAGPATTLNGYNVFRKACPTGYDTACCDWKYMSVDPQGSYWGATGCNLPTYTPPAPRTVLWTTGKPEFVCDMTKTGYCCQHDLGYAGTWNGCRRANGATYDTPRDESTWAGCSSSEKALCSSSAISGAGNQVGDCFAAYSKE